MPSARRPRRKTAEELQREVDLWNHGVAVGDAVVVRLDSGEQHQTKTASAAWLLGDHTPVVMCDGIRGAYLLDRVTPVSKTAATST